MLCLKQGIFTFVGGRWAHETDCVAEACVLAEFCAATTASALIAWSLWSHREMETQNELKITQ